jgi:hypothetical protein
MPVGLRMLSFKWDRLAEAATNTVDEAPGKEGKLAVSGPRWMQQ